MKPPHWYSTAVIFCGLLFSILSSCDRKPTYPRHMQSLLEAQVPDYQTNYDSIYIIPRLGCRSCTSAADKIVKGHIDDARSLFVFTDLVSQKVLRIEYGSERLNKNNVIVDTEKHFKPYEYEESVYPVLLIVQDDGTLKFNYLLDCMIW